MAKRVVTIAGKDVKVRMNHADLVENAIELLYHLGEIDDRFEVYLPTRLDLLRTTAIKLLEGKFKCRVIVPKEVEGEKSGLSPQKRIDMDPFAM